MKFHTILPALLCSTFILHSSEGYLGTLPFESAEKTLRKEYCQKTKENNRLCMYHQISYPVLLREDEDALAALIEEKIKPFIQSYNRSDPQEEIRDFLKEDGYETSGKWDQTTQVELFAATPETFTLSVSQGGYTGGAHGNHTTSFVNYSRKTGKKIVLKDLFIDGYDAKLKEVAEEYYKAYYGLKPGANLTDAGWFENRFVLADTFAITPKGLYFHYNAYEIKPYSEGETTLLLPYDRLSEIIKPESFLAPLATKSMVETATFRQEDMGEITLKSTLTAPRQVKLEVNMKNLSFHQRGWLSLSFPQLQSKKSIQRLKGRGFKTLHAYGKGSKIYHTRLHKAVRSRYLLVEGEARKWKKGESRSITLLLDLPADIEELFLDIRGSFKEKGKKAVSFPEIYDGVEGQQGFGNYRMRIGL
jgi:hypothetical protein